MSDKLDLGKGAFPSPILPNSVKNSKNYGLGVARSIYSAIMSNETAYYNERNKMFKENRLFANGKQPISTYLAIMGIDKDDSFINLEYHPRPIAPHFRDILVNTIMEKIERIECTGLSLDIKKRKNDKKNDAAFRMKEKDFINSMNGESGIEFEDPDAFTPENEEELDLWSELNDKEREELLMEEGINFVMYNNDWNAIKKELAGDLVDTALGGTQNYFDGANRIRLRRIKSEYGFHGKTEGLDLNKVGYMGHMERMSVVDARCQWPSLSEKELYSSAKASASLYGNGGELEEWADSWENGYARPYDGYLIDVMFFEYKVTKYINYVKGSDRNGRKVFDIKDGIPKANENKKANSIPIPTIYAGAWIVGSENLPKWGEMENLLRSNEDKEDIRFSYSMYMLNNDGSMMPLSPMAHLRSSIIQMDLAVMKIQQTLANTPPDGVEMDIDAVIDIDFGTGIGKMNPMQLRNLRLQTGDRYYSGRAAGGDRESPPMRDAKYQIGDKITQFINVYNWEFNNIRAYISINEATDGIGVDERKGLQVMNNQIKASNTATGHIYGGFINIMNNTAKGIAIRLWDTLKQSDSNSMYMKLLGRENIDFIKKRKDITSSNYDVMISVNLSPDDKMQLELNIERTLSTGQIELEDAVIVREYAKTNPKKAVKYLTFIKKQRLRQAQEARMKEEQAAQDQIGKQQQDLAAQAQIEQKAMDTLEVTKAREKGVIELEISDKELIRAALVESMKTGAELHPYVKMLIDKQVDLMTGQAKDEAIMEEEEELMAQEQEQMAIEEQGMGDQMLQDEMPIDELPQEELTQ